MRRKFNKVMFDYLQEHGEEHIVKEWVKILRDKFNEEYTLHELQHYFVRHHLPVKYEMPNKRNHSLAHDIGSERTKADGMVQIKVAPHKWEYKQRYIYEKYYNVELKEDEYIIFLDQDRNNFNIDNLKLISRKESAYMANLGVFSKEPIFTETGLKIAKLKIKTKEKEDYYDKSGRIRKNKKHN